MVLRIEPFSPADVEEVKAFNRRLRDGGQLHQFPEDPRPAWLPREEGAPVWQELYLAKNDGAVNGAYLLKPQPFAIQGVDETVTCYGLPISEGIVDRRHGMVGVQILRDATARNPLLFCLGIGGEEEASAKLFTAMKWRLVPCSFHFRVLAPFRFLRHIAHLRRTTSRRLALDTLAFTGIGSIGVRALTAWKGRAGRRRSNWTSTVDADFDVRVDDVWTAARANYSLIARRDLSVLRTLYPTSDPRFIRLHVTSNGSLVGWAVLLNTAMHGDKYFGDLRVGTVVDCLAVPGHEDDVVAAATRELRRRRADLVVSNQLHRDWQAAFDHHGFLRGPSNFLFAAAPGLVVRLDPFEHEVERVHMTRGDGDGPINL